MIQAGCSAGSDGAQASSNDNQGWSNLGTSGAQDIGQFRSILESGGIPSENTLDANGFFNEHVTELPEPDCGQAICLHGMLAVHSDWIWNDYQATLQLGMNTTMDASSLPQRPRDLVVVVDTSGSMASEDKMTYVKQGLHLLVDTLDPEDRMALVRYDSAVTVLTDLLEPTEATTLHEMVTGLYPDGATNFYGGLETGLQMALEAANPERERRVIMLSDGQPTAGAATDNASIIEMAERYIGDGIGVTTIGVGLAFNVELMRGLAERGAGNFYFLESAAAIDEVFTQELDFFVTPVAYDLELEVVSGAAYSLGEVVGTHLWQTDGFRGSISIPAVFLASRRSPSDPPEEDPRRRGGGSAILIDLIPQEAWQGLADPHRMAELKLRYRLAGSEELLEQTVVVQNPKDPGVAEELPFYTHVAIAKNHAMYNIFLGLREACRQAMVSHNYALWVLEQLEERASAWNLSSNDPDIAADLLLIDQFIANLEAKGAWAVEPGAPYDYTYPCGYEGCMYEDDMGGFFFCSAGKASDTSPIALALILVVLGAWRRGRAGRPRSR
jgi:Ca-activated chloride channel family protein